MRGDPEILCIGLADSVHFDFKMAGVDGADGKSVRRSIGRKFSHLVVGRWIEQAVAALIGDNRIGR